MRNGTHGRSRLLHETHRDLAEKNEQRWGGGGVDEGEVAAGCHGGGGSPSRPPWTSGRSGKHSGRRERAVPWELGRLRRGCCEELEGRGRCLGGFYQWCGSFQANRRAFYRRERERELGFRGWSGGKVSGARRLWRCRWVTGAGRG
jgi:hypothetical protein